MHTPRPSLPPPDPRVSALASQCLEEIDVLVEEWAAYVGPVRASYADLVTDQESHDSAWQAFELLLRTVAQLPVPEHIAGVSERVGEERARQGVPLAALLEAARVNFHIVWSALVRRADEEEKARLVSSAYLVWEAVGGHVTGIMTAYQRTVLEMGRRAEDERRLWFARLRETGGSNPIVVRDAALALGFQPGERFVCAVAALSDGAALHRAAAALRSSDVPLQLQGVASDVVLTVQLGARVTRDVVLKYLQEAPCGVSSEVAGLAQVPRAVELATATARVLPAGATGPRRLEESWLDVLVHRSEGFGHDLAADVLGGLASADVPGSEAERLLDTVRIHLAGTGSVADTAAALYCHRNTIRHRFDRFAELTGYDVRRPEDAALLTLALRARTQLTEATGR
ncbi:helix-turn-helix domain-containing protein [Streptomyces sp. Pv4-95]|uniref:PucR family transcriptional regulator n=1 Tax=Streptomyces sp. Pv4-95 TaxID=3049543 RepID=UPI003892125C